MPITFFNVIYFCQTIKNPINTLDYNKKKIIIKRQNNTRTQVKK